MMQKSTNGLAGLKLKQLAPEDLEALLALQETVLQGLPDPAWFVVSQREEHMETLSRGEVFGCLAGKKLVGFAVLSPWNVRGKDSYAAKLGESVENTLDVRDVMVHPDYRRRGIHSAFLRLFEETGRITGIRAMYATIAPENLPSVKCFEKAGYCLIKAQPAYDGRLRSFYRKTLNA